MLWQQSKSYGFKASVIITDVSDVLRCVFVPAGVFSDELNSADCSCKQTHTRSRLHSVSFSHRSDQTCWCRNTHPRQAALRGCWEIHRLGDAGAWRAAERRACEVSLQIIFMLIVPNTLTEISYCQMMIIVKK